MSKINVDQLTSKIRMGQRLNIEELKALDPTANNYVQVHIHFVPEDVEGYLHIELDPQRPSFHDGFSADHEFIISESGSYREGSNGLNNDPDWLRVFCSEQAEEERDKAMKGVGQYPEDQEALDANNARYFDAINMDVGLDGKSTTALTVGEALTKGAPEASFAPEVEGTSQDTDIDLSQMIAEGDELSMSKAPDLGVDDLPE